MEVLQFVYFCSGAWYGSKLAFSKLKNGKRNFDYRETRPNQIFSAPNATAILFSFLTSREFHKIFKALADAGIPFLSKDRNKNHPIVIAGGAAMFQPEPIADMIDVICLGDGEEFLDHLDACLSLDGRDKRIDALAELPGAYVPARRKIVYDRTGFFVKDVLGETRKIVPNVTDQWSAPVPVRQGATTVEKLELARGCNNNCFFCSITWRNPFRERPREGAAREILSRADNKLEFFAPNTGGVSYYSELEKLRANPICSGDITVNDFLKLPEPNENDYNKQIFTFGVEGVSERLRRLIGKPISGISLDRVQERIVKGMPRKQQFYFIRGIPTESESDWKELDDFIAVYEPIWREYKIATELQFTPLTKQPHTPLQWFEHKYNRRSEEKAKALLEWARKMKKDDDSSIVYVSVSRREASWLIDTLCQNIGRNGLKFIYAIYKNVLSGLEQDSFVGQGSERVKGVLRKSGIDADVILGKWDFDAALPWAHIVPGGDKNYEKLLKASHSVERRLGNYG